MSIVDFNSATWTDPWVRKLPKDAKILFLYLWTNNHKNLIALYPIDIDTMAFETALNKKEVLKALTALRQKVKYDPVNERVWIVNHVRHQYLRTGKVSVQIVKGIKKCLIAARHPFANDFLRVYGDLVTAFPELQEIQIVTDKVYRGSIEGSIDPPGKGKGKGGGKGLKNNEAFEEFWEAYPARNGKKLLKADAQEAFKRIKDGDIPLLLQAVGNYAVSKTATDGFAKDAVRFLKKDVWRDWIEPEGKDGGEDPETRLT